MVMVQLAIEKEWQLVDNVSLALQLVEKNPSFLQAHFRSYEIAFG